MKNSLQLNKSQMLKVEGDYLSCVSHCGQNQGEVEWKEHLETLKRTAAFECSNYVNATVVLSFEGSGGSFFKRELFPDIRSGVVIDFIDFHKTSVGKVIPRTEPAPEPEKGLTFEITPALLRIEVGKEALVTDCKIVNRLVVKNNYTVEHTRLSVITFDYNIIKEFDITSIPQDQVTALLDAFSERIKERATEFFAPTIRPMQIPCGQMNHNGNK